MLCHSLSCLLLFCPANKPGIRWFEFLRFIHTYWSQQPARTSSSDQHHLVLCIIHKKTQPPGRAVNWSWWCLFVFAGSGGEQLRAALHQLCQWAPPAFFQPDCHCPGRGKWSSCQQGKGSTYRRSWGSLSWRASFSGEARNQIDLGLLNSTCGILGQRPDYLTSSTNSVVN